MIEGFDILTITDTPIEDKTILLRVDFDVSLNPDHTIANDVRITQTLPTIKLLLEKHNKLIIMSHLGRPEGRDTNLSLSPAVKRLQEYLPDYQVALVDDFLSDAGKEQLKAQTPTQVLMLENLRFYPEEKKNDEAFAKALASLGEVYVDDAFAVAHRNEASVVSVPKFLPHYAGLLLEKEIKAIGSVLRDPKKPIVAIIGGAKTSDKLPLLYRLTEIADHLLVGGGIANTFLKAEGKNMGKSLVEDNLDEEVRKIIAHAKEKNTTIVLPKDGICASDKEATETTECMLDQLTSDLGAFDIGSETQAIWGNVIAEANTIIWNGPVGYMENPAFARGTEFLYYSITQNGHAFSVVGGGDTLNAISKREYLDKISHISTGGGAMLEFIEKGTLPGLEALKR